MRLTQPRATLLLREIATPVLDRDESRAQQKGNLEIWRLVSNPKLLAGYVADFFIWVWFAPA